MRTLVLLLALMVQPALAQAYAPECDTGLYPVDMHRTFEIQLDRLRANREIAREVEFTGEDAKILADADSRIYQNAPGTRRIRANRARVLWVQGKDEVWFVYGQDECFVTWIESNHASTDVILDLVGYDRWQDDTY